jgi:hypothetical protein
MYALEPGEIPSRTLTWKPLGFLSHFKRRTNDDRFTLVTLGGLVLLEPWCTNSGFNWTFSAVCL